MQRHFILCSFFFCLLAMVGHLHGWAQSEAESSANAILFQTERGEMVGEVRTGEQIKVYHTDWHQPKVEGTLEAITDSAIVVAGQRIAISDIGSIKGISHPSVRRGLGWFVGALLGIIVMVACVYLLEFAIIAYAAGAAILAGFGILFGGSFFVVALVLGIVMLASGRSTYYDLRFLKAKVARYLYEK